MGATMIKKIFYLLLIFSLIASECFATTATITSSKSVYLDGANATTNNNSLGLEVRHSTTSPPTFSESSLVNFDLSSITAGSTCTTAVLKLTCDGTTSSGSWDVHQLLRTDWDEGQATWNVYKTATNWGTAGALGSGTDVSGNPANGSGRLAHFTGSCAVDDVISFTDDGMCAYISSLFGSGTAQFAILQQTNGNVKLNAADDETADSSKRPKLEVTYTAPGGGSRRRVYVAE